jgi:poly(3-hydroxybutyrate) depolymerase
MNFKHLLAFFGALGATISVCSGQDAPRATGSGGTSGAIAPGAAIPMGNPPVLSAGCGKATMLKTGKDAITSTGQERTYIIDIPDDYDMNKPYRLFYTSHWISGTSEGVRDMDYYSLKTLAYADNEPAIFVAPQSDGATWQEKDHALFDDLLAFVKENLCIDTTRVFATGFSFGGMITYSLAANHQDDIRAAVGIAPANYNIYVPPKTHQPIAWMHTTGMSDTLTPWINGDSTTQGSKFIAIEHATDNECTVPAEIPTWQEGNHVCYDFTGCGASFPTKVCTFDGGHSPTATDPGSDTNWIPEVSWAFFKQF